MPAGTIEEKQTEVAQPVVALAARQFIPFSLAALLVTCTFWTVDVTSPALPEIKDDLDLSAKGAGLIFSLLFLGRLIGNFPSAHSLVRFGSPRTASMGGALLALGSAIAMVAPNIEVLYLARIVQGIGVSLLVNAGLRSILFARPGRGSAVTIFGIAATIGGVIGLQSGGFLTGHQGWRAVFALSTVLGLLLIFLPLLGTKVGRRGNQPVPVTADEMLQSAALRTYLSPLLINFLIFCNYAIWVILPLYAQWKFDIGPEMTATLLLIISVVHLLFSLPAIQLIRRFGSPAVLIAMLLVTVAGTIGVIFAPSAWLLVIPLVLYGCGMLGAVNAAGDIVLHRGGAGARAVGALRQSSDLGLVIGPVVAGALADSFGYGAPFIVFSVLMVAAAGAAAVVPGMLKPSVALGETG